MPTIRTSNDNSILKLNVRKKEFLHNCAKDYKPFYIRVIEQFGESTLSFFTTLILLAFLPYLIWVIFVIIAGYSTIISKTLYTLYLPTIMIIGVLFLRYSYYLLLNSSNSKYILDGICDNSGMTLLERWMRIMFTSEKKVYKLNTQVYKISIVVILGILNSVLFYYHHAFAFEIQSLPLWINIYWFAYVGYVTIFVAPGIWLAIDSMLWIKKYVSPSCMRIQALRPQRHVALRTISSILSAYAFMFSIETSLVLSAFFAFHLKDDFFLVTIIRNGWLIVFIPLIILLFVYPQILIRKMISEAQKSVNEDIENKITCLYYNDDLSIEDMDKIVKYFEIEEKLADGKIKDNNSEIYLLFITAIVTPIIVYLKQFTTDEIIAYISNIFNSLMQKNIH